MADSPHTTNLPRRAVLAGAAVTILGVTATGASPSGLCANLARNSARQLCSPGISGDPIFADKKRATVAAWDELHALYEEQERRIDALQSRPVLPKELLQPLRLPGQATPAAIGEEGWCEETLSKIVRTGVYMTAKTTPTANGATIRTEWKPVSAKTRKQAAELLKVRQAYDAARAAWWDEVSTIESTSSEPLRRFIDLAFNLMAYPVSTVAAVREKLELVEEFDLFNLTDDEADLRGWLIRDALAAAEKAVSHG